MTCVLQERSAEEEEEAPQDEEAWRDSVTKSTHKPSVPKLIIPTSSINEYFCKSKSDANTAAMTTTLNVSKFLFSAGVSSRQSCVVCVREQLFDLKWVRLCLCCLKYCFNNKVK